jgi:hypothetical protein
VASINTDFGCDSAMIEICTGVPAVKRVGPVNARAHLPHRSSRVELRRPRQHGDVLFRRSAGTDNTPRPADDDARQVTRGHRRDRLELCGIDDTKDRIRRRGLDHVAGVVPALGDDARKARGHHRAAGERVGCAGFALRPGQRAFGVRLVALGFFELPFRGDAAIDQSGNARHGGPGTLDPRARLHDLGALGRRARIERRDVETHQDIAGADAIAFSLRQFRDAGGLRRDDRPFRAGAGITMPVTLI